MDESRDEQLEILDVGGLRSRGWTDADGPATQLDDQLPEARSDRSPSLRRAAMVLGAVVLAVVATAIVMDTRHESIQDAAAADTVNLVAGEVQDRRLNPGQSPARLSVDVLNAGPRDVDILSIHPTGWSSPADEDLRARTLAAGEWTVVPMPVEPACDGPTPPTFEVELRTETADQTVTLKRSTISGFSPMEWVRDEFCQPTSDEVYIGLEGAELLTPDSDGLPMRLLVYSDQSDGVVVSDVTSSTPGFAVESVELPATLASNFSSTAVKVIWTVTDCDEATTFDDAGVDFHVNDDRRVYSEGWIPTAAVAALARYALTVCGE